MTCMSDPSHGLHGSDDLYIKPYLSSHERRGQHADCASRAAVIENGNAKELLSRSILDPLITQERKLHFIQSCLFSSWKNY